MSAETSPTPDQPRVTTLAPPPGFAPGIGRYVAMLEETRAELLTPVAGLSPEQLAWHPDAQTESIGTHLLHVAAVEWSWVFEEMFGRSGDEYDGWEEAMPIRFGLPQVRDRPLAGYADRLDRVRTEVRAALWGRSDDDLPRLVAGRGSAGEPALLDRLDPVPLRRARGAPRRAGRAAGAAAAGRVAGSLGRWVAVSGSARVRPAAGLGRRRSPMQRRLRPAW